MHSCCARDKAEAFGIKILCSVLTFPRTFSQKLLSISAGKGSLAPKSPSRSGAVALIFSEFRLLLRGRNFWGFRVGVLERERKGEKMKCGAEAMGGRLELLPCVVG